MTFADSSKYHGLEMHENTRYLLHYHQNRFYACCNGVGSPQGGWFKRLIYHITPNTIWGLNIKLVADIHDVEYTYPAQFNSLIDALNWKASADLRFQKNCIIHIRRQNSFKWIEKLRIRRANSYKFLLSHCGDDAFMSGKTIKKIRLN